MMEMSRRAKRMEKHHARQNKSGLNLVSLMDIFTILVFFLLVSSSNVQQLPQKKDIHLPTSISQKVPDENIVITVSTRAILVQGRQVEDLDAVIGSKSEFIDGLQKELVFQASNSRMGNGINSEGKGRAVTVMGDEDMSYEVLRKILATCREANYTQIAFAAYQKAQSREGL